MAISRILPGQENRLADTHSADLTSMSPPLCYKNGLLVATTPPEPNREDYIPLSVALSGVRRLSNFSRAVQLETRYSAKIIHHHDVALLPLYSHVKDPSAVG